MQHINSSFLPQIKIFGTFILLPLAWDLQGRRGIHFLLLPSSIQVFLRPFLSKLWLEALKPLSLSLFFSYFSIILVQSSYFRFQNFFFILIDLILDCLFLWNMFSYFNLCSVFLCRWLNLYWRLLCILLLLVLCDLYFNALLIYSI